MRSHDLFVFALRGVRLAVAVPTIRYGFAVLVCL